MSEQLSRVAMVSGGGRGLGASITRRLLDDGWSVSVGARDPERARSNLPAAANDKLHLGRFDATIAETAAHWTAQAVAHFGRLDALVNNAGIWKMVSFDHGSEQDLDDLWSTNVKGPFQLVKAVLPHLRKVERGRVINIASTDAKRYRDTSASLGYVMTKHALLAMSHAVRFAAWDDGVRATAICPGAIDTDMIAGVPGVTPKHDRLQPDTIADLVAFVLDLPNQASVPEIVANTRLESTL